MAQTSITSWFKATPSSTVSDAAGSSSSDDAHPPLPRAHQPPPSAPPPPAATFSAPPSSLPPAAAAAVSIHPSATLRAITPADILPLRRLLSLMLPVVYPDSFFKPLLQAPGSRHSRLIVWADPTPTIVGALICRTELRPPAQPPALYLQALCLLSPYQGLGLMAAALDHALASAAREDAVAVMDAHVWTASHDALAWYARRGFERIGRPIEGYYQKLQPASAWVVARHADHAKPQVQLSITPAAPTAAVSAPPKTPTPQSTLAAALNLPGLNAASASSSTTSLALSTGSAGGPPRGRSTQSPGPPPGQGQGQSFQNQAPATSWNDLPDDMAGGSIAGGTRSKTSSTTRKKRDRSYPTPTY